jgi:hypothetical protein
MIGIIKLFLLKFFSVIKIEKSIKIKTINFNEIKKKIKKNTFILINFIKFHLKKIKKKYYSN